ncbi:endonuclease-reverse transcriptase [Lasius niger]|uniref:Endonuclease-reverse transcriptase n=1 Tax=Lasius niger TaxID=67767 RepID=A0A0J7N6T9_LASNI|nr:endonuclease-reverse transcriptase [Lasius niger]
MVLFFVDLRAAFDSVGRIRLLTAMRERGKRRAGHEMRGYYKGNMFQDDDTGGNGGRVLNGEGVRQGCLLSPLLFNLLVADLEEEMRRGGLEEQYW